MELAKNCVDVGLFTNRLEEMRSFYGDRLKLPYEELLPVGSGVQQHRYGLLGSVLKINHSRNPLPPRVHGGYRRISIADSRTPMPLLIEDPDGTAIELVPSGQRGIDQIEVQLGVTDEASFERFYSEALGCERLDAGRYKLGRTILGFARDPQAPRAHKAEAGSAVQALDSMRATGVLTSPSRCAIATPSTGG